MTPISFECTQIADVLGQKEVRYAETCSLASYRSTKNKFLPGDDGVKPLLKVWCQTSIYYLTGGERDRSRGLRMASGFNFLKCVI
jgi:hypothetical protein